MRILIVGCGYVGTALGAQLAKNGHQVFGLNRSPGREQELAALGIKPLSADITKSRELAALPQSYDCVVSCVAAGGGGVDQYRKVYLEGTRNLIRWLAADPPKKFVYTGSTSVYGQNDGSVVTESSPAEPTAETARVLRETEDVLLRAAPEFPAIILRVAGIYGPSRGYWFKQFAAGQATIEGTGKRILNMIHRDDVAGAIVAALKSGRPGEVYNAVDDEPVSQLELFRWLSGKLKRELPPFGPQVPDTRKRGAANKRISNCKLKDELGYKLKYPTFREGFDNVNPK